MTNKPMLSVDRELLEEMLAALKETHSLPAKFYGSTLGDRVRAILQSQNEQADPLAIGTLHRDCDERIVFESSGEIHIKDGMQVYAEPAAQHQPAPVAFVIDIESAAKKLAQCMDYPWEYMPEQGRQSMREHAKAVVEASRLNGVKS